MYLEPVSRRRAARVALECHLGNDKCFVTHEMMGAGHPPMPFELDTYTAIEPAHFVVNDSYIQRKGKPNDMQIWAIGQAMDVQMRMDLILDPSHAPQGFNLELSLFDCQSCHHSMSELQCGAAALTGLRRGRIKLYDATAVMLVVAAQRIAPDQAKKLADHLLALHAALGQDWNAVKQEASAVRDAVNALMPALASHDFNSDDAAALAVPWSPARPCWRDLDYSGAQQQVMALESIVAAMKLQGFADDKQIAGLNDALSGLYTAVANDQKYDPDTYVAAVKTFGAKLPQ